MACILQARTVILGRVVDELLLFFTISDVEYYGKLYFVPIFHITVVLQASNRADGDVADPINSL